MKLILHFIFSLFLLGFSEAGRWEDGDTVIIDALTPDDDDPSRFKREIQEEGNGNLDEDTILIKSQRCLTPRGQTGQCVSLRECFPVLFPADPNVELADDSTLSNNLTDLLIASSGFCGGGEYHSDSPSLFAQVVRAELLVCCVPQSEIPTPLPPQQQNVTVHDVPSEERNSCGLIKIDAKTIPPYPTVTVEGGTETEGKNRTTGERIVDGREAKRGEFPWIVTENSRQFCGGSLIDESTILTAAHCIQHMGAADVQKLTIQIGDHDIATTSDGRHEVRTATRILYHRGFSMKHLHHDVALITLSQPVSFGTYIQPVCLHTGSTAYDNVVGDVAGWGQLYDNGPQPTKLQTAAVRVLPHAECVKRYSGNSQVTIGKGMVCAGGDGKDSCRGDSGGPLTIDSKTRAQIVGIVSWGIGCGSYPGVYTRVDQYLPWINKNRKRSFT